MHSIRTRLAGALLVASATVALMASAQGRAPSDLRVCADPYDMPFSNNQEEGFENKIAHLVARDLNATVINYWWPSRRGVLRNSILGGFCDVMIQAPIRLARTTCFVLTSRPPRWLYGSRRRSAATDASGSSVHCTVRGSR